MWEYHIEDIPLPRPDMHVLQDGLENNVKKDIKIPFNIEFNFMFDVAIKKPTIIHIKNAERFASQVNLRIIMGITSIIPAIIPNKIPILIFCINQFIIYI